MTNFYSAIGSNISKASTSIRFMFKMLSRIMKRKDYFKLIVFLLMKSLRNHEHLFVHQIFNLSFSFPVFIKPGLLI